MAFIDFTNTGDFGKFYNVNYAVGRGRGNPADVMLVQYMLKKVFQGAGECRPLRNMYVDGVPGPTTQAYIDAFQAGCLFIPGTPSGMVRDGIVDSAPRGHGQISNSLAYTILILNATFRMLFPDLFDGLPDAPDLPPLLAVALHSKGGMLSESGGGSNGNPLSEDGSN